ncbi:hypothetical protein TSAR_012891 [Trichomalopsis sarcophagae]|uniref:Alpha-1,3-glucosyltransferase n=1 Tax=Trichomalopsis sarcophagae TaxID=543379 RepID=A0A232F1I2_9HYME|nr:hypothetical protein TSAR_012891 [Trichomalopsis sarcophagae]
MRERESTTGMSSRKDNGADSSGSASCSKDAGSEREACIPELLLTGLIVSLALLLRWCISYHPYSGAGKPPMFGDYEAQRHWQEITLNLPVSQWYSNSSDNDLQYWGLDYPPITAYHSLLLARVANLVDPDSVKLHQSRGYESNTHKYFMRLSVLVVDFLLFIPAVIYFAFAILPILDSKIKKQQDKNEKRDFSMLKKRHFVLATVLFYPGLILIDYGHFQYNCVSLGLFIASVSALFQGAMATGSFFFVLALNYKQMELYHALPCFFYILGINTPGKRKPLLVCLRSLICVSLTVIVTFALIWAPFLTDRKVFMDTVLRLFPLTRAPGKVILFGEHSVVYGKTAVAASLGLRSSLHFTELPHEECIIHVKMPKLGISKIYSLHQVKEDFLRLDFYTINHDVISQKLRKYVAKLGFENPDQRLSMQCFFYAIVQAIIYDDLRLSSFILELDSELSIGAGAGSSASFSVCLVACFLYWSQLQKHTNLPNEFDSASLDKISDYALNCEKIMHGKPSGIDNSVCTFGSVIEFRKPEPPKFITLGSKSLRVLLVDTKVARSTKLLVEKFGALSSSFPTIFKDMLQVYDELAMQALDIIKKIHDTPENDQDRLLKHYDELSLLVDINQGLLATCQVSHETLDTICKTAKKHGFSAKLTGAGGGGFAYVLIPPNVNNEKVEDLTNELKIQGFSVTETKLGGSGVEVNDMNDDDAK